MLKLAKFDKKDILFINNGLGMFCNSENATYYCAVKEYPHRKTVCEFFKQRYKATGSPPEVEHQSDPDRIEPCPIQDLNQTNPNSE